MKDNSHLEVSLDARGVLRIALDRPSTGNALDGETVLQLLNIFAQRPVPEEYRVVVLRGNGPEFSSGNDAQWLERTISASDAENLLDAKNLAAMLDALDGFAVPVVGAVQGCVRGNAVGLVAACDVVVADAQTTFQSPEVLVGLAPACVAPFLVAKIGQSHARGLLLTGREYDAEFALDIRLIHEIVPAPRDLDAAVDRIVEDLLRGAPRALKETKHLIRRLTFHGHSILTTDTLEDSATCFADSRHTPEAIEGMNALRERRDPAWLPKD